MQFYRSIFLSLSAGILAIFSTQLNAATQGNQPQVIMPNAGMRAHAGMDITASADFLYLEAHQGNLDFAKTGTVAGSVGAANLKEGSYYQPDFQYDPGFRIGVGSGIGHDGWSVLAQYTWYLQNLHKTTVEAPKGTADRLVTTSNLEAVQNIPLNSASGEWRNQLNVFDIELGRDSYFSKYLALRSFIGLRGAWQDQKFNVHYEYTGFGDVNTAVDIPQTQSSWGIGLRTGVDSTWFFTPNWSIYSNLATNFLYSHFTVDGDAKAYATANPANTTQYLANLKRQEQALQPVIEMAMGIGYDIWFANDAYHFGLRAGWEEQFWLQNNYLSEFGQPSVGGDLSLQGFVLKARLDF